MSKYCVDHFESQDTGYKIDVMTYPGGRYWGIETREYCVSEIWLDISGIERNARFAAALQASGLRIADALRDEHCKLSHMSGNKTRYHVKVLFNGGATSVENIENVFERAYQDYERDHPGNRFNRRDYYHYIREDQVQQITAFIVNGYLMEQSTVDLSDWVVKGLYELLNEAGITRR